jgi:hypothetical protein
MVRCLNKRAFYVWLDGTVWMVVGRSDFDGMGDGLCEAGRPEFDTPGIGIFLCDNCAAARGLV